MRKITMIKRHIETDEQYRNRVIKEGDLIIYELQHYLEKAEAILNSVSPDSNPAYIKSRVDRYFRDKKAGK